MAEIKASSADIVAIGNEILDLCKQYDDQIDDLFESFSKINQRAWSGNAANAYVMRLAAERSIYKDFGQYLKYYGNTVKKIGENLDKTINKWENK